MGKFEEKLDEAILTEEAAVQVYMYSLKSALSLLNIPNAKKEIIQEKIKILAEDSKKHAKILKAIKKMELS